LVECIGTGRLVECSGSIPILECSGSIPVHRHQSRVHRILGFRQDRTLRCRHSCALWFPQTEVECIGTGYRRARQRLALSTFRCIMVAPDGVNAARPWLSSRKAETRAVDVRCIPSDITDTATSIANRVRHKPPTTFGCSDWAAVYYRKDPQFVLSKTLPC
jgi:hypothetical protein